MNALIKFSAYAWIKTIRRSEPLTRKMFSGKRISDVECTMYVDVFFLIKQDVMQC